MKGCSDSRCRSSISRRLLPVVLLQIDRMVRHIVIPPLDPQVHHEGRAGELLLLHPLILSTASADDSAPAAASPRQSPHSSTTASAGSVVVCRLDPHSFALPFSGLEQHLFHRLVEQDLHAHLPPRSAPSPASPPRSRPSDETPHAHTQETTESKTGSDTGTGDIPRYFDWKLNPSRIRSSLKCEPADRQSSELPRSQQWQ